MLKTPVLQRIKYIGKINYIGVYGLVARVAGTVVFEPKFKSQTCHFLLKNLKQVLPFFEILYFEEAVPFYPKM